MLKNAQAIIDNFSRGDHVIYRYLHNHPHGVFVSPCPNAEDRVLVEFDGERKSVHCTAIQHRSEGSTTPN